MRTRMWITTQRLPKKRELSQKHTGKIHDIGGFSATFINAEFFTSKREKLKELQSNADQPEICKTRHHKPEQTENKQEKQKSTNKIRVFLIDVENACTRQVIS